MKTIYQVPERIEVYDLLQESLLAIPGHARYLADEIKREQKKVASYPTTTGPRVSYDFNRSRYFETLGHLPSPETVAVLGDFLSDDIDTPHPLLTPGSDWGENPRANSFAASFTIMNIGLRNPPAAIGTYDADPDAHLAKTRAWWETIKSGGRTFSFKGQAVEYRFKPDGTWDAISLANPPDDGPKPATAENPAGNPTPLPAPVKSQPSGNSWPWIIGAAMILLSVVAWLGIKSRSRPA